MILLTDLLLAAVAGWLAWRLRRGLATDNRAAWWWSLALALIALTALTGGLYHAQQVDLSTAPPDFSAPIQWSWWVATLFLTCGVSLAMDFSLLHVAFPAGLLPLWRTAVVLKFVIFCAAAIVHPYFLVAIACYGLSLIAWTIAAALYRRPWSGWMLAGIGLSVAAALLQQKHSSISVHLLDNDLYHVIQAIALYAFYRAGRLFAPKT
jgi:hypothetical protein